MILSLLFSSPLLFLAWVIAVVVVLTIHEFSHALVGTLLGDPTAKNSGRLTLNPFAHISWSGFLLLILVGFGWGKPVPFNPYNLKYQKFGPALVALAGPLSNLLMAVASILVYKFLFINGIITDSANLLFQFLQLLVVLNIVLAVFNLLPLPPLDGSKVLFSFLSDYKYAAFRDSLEEKGPYILIAIVLLDNVLGLKILSTVFFFFINWVYRLFV